MNPGSTVRLTAFAALFLSCSLAAAAVPTEGSAPSSAPAEKTFTRSEVTAIIANTRKIVSPRGIEELTPVPINGIPQYLSIRGRDLRNPILLFIHGGPASPEMPAAYTFQSPWEDYFTVVEWDQRGTGKTFAASDPEKIANTITIAQMTSDTEEVVRYLRTRFHKQKIFVIGHSWGTVLGTALAHEHPEWLYAYVGVGQMVNAQRSESLGYEFALRSARADHNAKAVKQLESLAPYPGTGPIKLERLSLDRTWLEYYGGLTWNRHNYDYDADAWELSPDYTSADLDAIRKGSGFTLPRLIPALLTYNIEQETEFRCPILIFNGRHDYSVSHEVAADWFGKLHAPYKKLVWFEESAHMSYQEQPGRFLEHLLTDVRPFAVRAGDVAPDEEEAR